MFHVKHNLDQEGVKRLMNWVYRHVDLSQHKYKIIDTADELGIMRHTKHYVSANYNGANCLMVFARIGDRNYTYMIDRKSLAYNYNQLNYDTLKIYGLSIKVDPILYKGTIFDGIHMFNKRTQRNYYAITDAFTFKGANVLNDNIYYKLYDIRKFIELHNKNEPTDSKFNIFVNKLYCPTEIMTMKDDIDKTKSYEFKGIAFYPEYNGTKMLFLNMNTNPKVTEYINNKNKPDTSPDNSDSDNDRVKRNNVVHHEQNTTDVDVDPEFEEVKMIPKNKITICCFEMRKTDNPDIYDLYCTEKGTYNGKAVLKVKKYGIAYIPNMKCSKMCREFVSSFMANGDKARILVNCVYDTDREKWIPTELNTTAKYPDTITAINNMFDQMIV